MLQKLRKKPLIYSIITVVMMLISIGAFELSKTSVEVVLDGKKEKIRTHAKTVTELINDLDVKLDERDHLSPSKNSKLYSGLEVIWEPAKKVTLVDAGNEKTIWTTADTISDILTENQIKLDEADVVTPSKDKKVKNNMRLEVNRAFTITLNDGLQQKNIKTTSTTVADLLKQQGVKLDEMDRVEPNLESIVNGNAVVKIIRVEKVTDVVEEALEFPIVTRKDANLVAGNKKVVKQGQKGIVQKKYEVVLENGKEVSRKIIDAEVLKESSEQIVAVGTKQVAKTVSRNNDTVAKEFYVKATAYTAYCNGCSGITSTGVNLRKNPDAKVIAVDPSVIPLGTKVYVEGYGYAVAADTGSAIKGNKIDLFMSDASSVKGFGVKTVKIKILD